MNTEGKFLLTLGILMLIGGLFFSIYRLSMRIYIANEYNGYIECHWDLADRSSTIEQKSKRIDMYIAALERANLHGVNYGMFYQTPQKDFDCNFEALKTLQKRLYEIKGMDEQSFAYQTAIQQITQQEQGEAEDMTKAFYNCWEKQNYYTYWNWIICVTFLLMQLALIVIGPIFIYSAYE